MANYIKANLINVFYLTGTEQAPVWKYFMYGQSDSLSMSSSTSSISSKMHGLHPDQEVSEVTFTMSHTSHMTISDANNAIKMANYAKPITFAFAKVTDTSGQTAADGLKPVTGYGTTETWTPDTSSFIKYGNGIVTGCTIDSQVGDVAQVSIDITGSGALLDAMPTGDNCHPFTPVAE